MKFINYLETITGVDVFGMASFFIFFTFFIGMAFWAWCADKKLMDIMRQLPLDGSDNN